jgi:hypothetical protein
MSKSYELKSRNILDQPVAPYIVRLMMGSTAIHAGWRWSNTVSDSRTDVSYGDFLLSAIATAGWAYETMVVVREAKRKGFVRRQMLAGNPELESYWDDSVAITKGGRLAPLEEIRNRFFGHFDARSARAVLRILRDREQAPDFAHFTEDAIPIFPMGLRAFEHWLGCDPKGGEQVKARLLGVTAAIGLTLQLVDRLLAELVDKYGIEVGPP